MPTPPLNTAEPFCVEEESVVVYETRVAELSIMIPAVLTATTPVKVVLPLKELFAEVNVRFHDIVKLPVLFTVPVGALSQASMPVVIFVALVKNCVLDPSRNNALLTVACEVEVFRD